MNYQQPNPEIPGWMGPDGLEWLYQNARDMREVVEIGSWFGRSTHALLTACKGTVYAVDHFLGTPNELSGQHRFAKEGGDVHGTFMQNVGHFPNLVVLKMASVNAALQFKDQSVDMVFIDGDHTYAGIMSDLTLWWPKCRKFFCGHDRGQDGVPQALREFGKMVLEGPDSMWSILCEP